MPDMYDKLGDLLNEALESGKINSESSAKAENIQDRDTSSENCDKSGLFYFRNNENIRKNNKKTIRIPRISKNNTGEVIKMHKYTENMHIPQNVQIALTTLDIAYPCSWLKIKHKYRLLLKQFHPDLQSTIQNTQDVLKNEQLTIDDIKNSYEILRRFYEK